MMSVSLFSGLLVSLFVPLAVGHFLIERLSPSPRLDLPERVSWAMVIGLASLIAVLQWGHVFGGIARIGWFLVAAVVLGTFLSKGSFVVQPAASVYALLAKTDVGGVVAAATVMVIGLLLLPLGWGGRGLFYEGTGNHDSIIYILNAERVGSHGFFDPAGSSFEAPVSSTVGAFVGPGAASGRIGSEHFLSFVSFLLGRDPTEVYLPVALSALVYFLAATYLFARTVLRIDRMDGVRRAVFLVLILGCPGFLYTFFNSNFANLYGIVFLHTCCACAPRVREWGWKWAVVGGLCVSALASVYTELILFLLLILGVMSVIDAVTHRSVRVLYADARGWLFAMGIAAIVNPLAWYATLGVLRDVSRVSATQGASWRDFMTGLPAYQKIAIGVLMGCGSLVRHPERSWLALSVGAFGGFRSFALGREARGMVCGVLVTLGCGFGYALLMEFTYGETKVFQYVGPLAYTIIMAGLLVPLECVPNVRYIKAAGYVPLLFPLIAVPCALKGLQRGATHTAKFKTLDGDYQDLRRLAGTLPKGAHVLVGDSLFPQGGQYFLGHWIPYFLRRTVNYYPGSVQRTGMHGGYFAGALEGSWKPGQDVEYLLVPARPGGRRVIDQPGRSVFRAGKFDMIRLDPSVGGIILPIEGVSDREADSRWVASRAVFEFDCLAEMAPGEPCWLNLSVGGADGRWPRAEEIEVTSAAGSVTLQVGSGAREYSLPMREQHGAITLIDRGRGRGPVKTAETKKGGDWAFRVSHISLTRVPLFNAVGGSGKDG
jgi:hypothetical protein